MAVLRHENLAVYVLSIAALCIWIVVQLEGSVSVSVIGRSHEKLLGIADCLQPVFCIVLVGHLRLILKTLSEQISVGVVGEGILLCQIAFPLLRCRHLTLGSCHLIYHIGFLEVGEKMAVIFSPLPNITAIIIIHFRFFSAYVLRQAKYLLNYIITKNIKQFVI